MTTTIIAGTGHRPPKLGGYTLAAQDRVQQFAIVLLDEYTPSRVISGMALGWDMALAGAAVQRGIPLTATVPFKGQEATWPPTSQAIYRRLLDQADQIVYVSPAGYASWKMQVRNRWMVEHCTTLLALWNGSDGGTANCVRYAQTRSVEVVNVWERWRTWENA